MPKSVANVKTTSKDMLTDEFRKFSQIFPQFVSEGKIDFDALKAFLADKNTLADDKDKYTFTWAGKKQSFQAISRPSYATLNPKIDESVDFDNTQNLFIEGDNLEVLKLLQKHYHGKIKMIYIDPPYNTGKDFIYKDNFTEGKSDYFERIGTTENGIRLETNSDAHGRYHSQWLSMMYPRLFLAKQLLREDGVIFISIDDNEQHHLKMLMNEVFGEGNFLNSIVLENDSRARPYGSIATTHEYIVAYSKNTDFIYEILSNPDKKFNYYDNEGGYDLYELRNRNIDFNINNRPNLYYSFWVNPNSKNDNDLYQISLEKEKGWVEVYPQESQGVKTVWRWGKDKAKSNLNTYIFAKKVDSNNQFRIVKKYRENTYTLNTVWTDKKIKTDIGTLETKALFNNKKYFSFPKPKDLIKQLLTISSIQDDIVLDFFAGSATTGHAVMDLNKQDGGNRQFILVQIPEVVNEASEAFKAGYKNIAEIGKERLRRAIKKYDFKAGFKVFSLAPTNYNTLKPYNGDDVKVLLEQEKLFTQKPLCDNFEPINLVYEIILKQGFSLNAKIEHKDDFYLIEDAELDRKLAITLQNPINTEQIEALKLTTDDILVCLDSALTDTQKVNFSRNFNLRVI